MSAIVQLTNFDLKFNYLDIAKETFIQIEYLIYE